MKRKLWVVILCVILLMLFLGLLLEGQTTRQVEEIVERNLKAVGGAENIRAIKNFSFRAGSNQYYVRPDGTMKVLTGRMDPVVILATLITAEGVIQNVFHDIRMLEGMEKSQLQCLGRLAGGLFSLASFVGSLSYQGGKQYGPERCHLISTRAYGLDITFFVDDGTFLISRMMLKAYSPAEGHFGFGYEFGPPQDVLGFKVPSSIFSAPVGTQTSVNPDPQAISEVQFSIPLEERFFLDVDINMGKVVVAEGLLKGNVLDVLVINPLRPPFAVVTNWQKRDIENAGMRTGDRLILEAGGLERELILRMPEDVSHPNANESVMTMEPLRGELFYLYFSTKDAEEAEPLKSRLTALLPIQVRKKMSVQTPSADEVIAMYLDELGGIERLRAWKGMIGTGKFVFPAEKDTEIPVKFWFEPPNKQRMEMTIQDQKAIYATDGDVPWYCDPTRGVTIPTPLPEDQADEMKKNDDEYPFIDYKEKGHRVELLGREEFEGREVYKVKLVRRNGAESTHFFDAGTGRELRYVMTIKRGGADIVQEAIERDFRRVGWLLMPFEIEIKINGRTVRKMIMKKIEVDPNLEDSLFQLPGKIISNPIKK